MSGPASIESNVDRLIKARPRGDGSYVANWTLTPETQTDPVVIQVNIDKLPIVFVPGIMGSNLRSKDQKEPIWRLDGGVRNAPTQLLRRWALATPGERQAILHPQRCEVDSAGHAIHGTGTLHSTEIHAAQGWGEVSESSYREFLLFLDEQLNSGRKHTLDNLLQAPGKGNAQTLESWRAEKTPVPLTEADLQALNRWDYPVYACGYNWLDSNEEAAKRLALRIKQIIQENDRGKFQRCSQVILVTHSMGGLVARRCQMLDGMSDRIAGVIHGVMPATGAAVAYRRTKVGMRDESFLAGKVLGDHGTDVTPVFAQSPGALQLLPNKQYPKGWLRINDDKGRLLKAYPEADPFDEIYANRKDWWGLINEQWLEPAGGVPWKWESYIIRGLEPARKFHDDLGENYHPNTYVYYGAPENDKDFNSIGKINWQMIFPSGGTSGMNPAEVPGVGWSGVRASGANLVSIAAKGNAEFWRMVASGADAPGDGTVPKISGGAPLVQNATCIKQQVCLAGFDHEAAYKAGNVQDFVLYAIAKIASQARTQVGTSFKNATRTNP